MGILSGNPKNEPLHYGEVFGIWSYLSTSKLCRAGYQTVLNHAGDGDLKKLIEEAIGGLSHEISQTEQLLKENGVGLPPTPPDRPAADLESIPAGARILDPEISAGVSMDIAAGLIACSTIIGQSVREDVAIMFGQFHTAKAMLGAKFLRLNKEKGWLVPPPLHLHTPGDAK
jgi:hypothetical protein